MLMAKKAIPFPHPETPGEKRIRDETAAYCQQEMMCRLWELESALRVLAFWKGMRPERLLQTVREFLLHSGQTPLFKELWIGNEEMPEPFRKMTPEQEAEQRRQLCAAIAQMREEREAP
jgi:hypothetical protein